MQHVDANLSEAVIEKSTKEEELSDISTRDFEEDLSSREKKVTASQSGPIEQTDSLQERSLPNDPQGEVDLDVLDIGLEGEITDHEP